MELLIAILITAGLVIMYLGLMMKSRWAQFFGLIIMGLGIATGIYHEDKVSQTIKSTVTAPAPEQKKPESSAILRALELEKEEKENNQRKETQKVNDARLVKEMEKKGVACDIWRGGNVALPSHQEWLDIYECARFAERIEKNTVLAKTLSYAHEKSLRIRVQTWTKSEWYAGAVALSVKESDDEIIAFLLGCNPEKNLNACSQDFQDRYGKLSDPYIRGGRSTISE